MLWNLPQIISPLFFSKRLPALPMLRLGSRTKPCPLFLEFINIFRQVPCVSAGIFLARKFSLNALSSPQIWCNWNAFLRFTLLHNSLRWTLSFPIFFVVSCGRGEHDGVIRSPFSNFPLNKLSLRVMLGHTTQLYRLLQQGNWSFATTFHRLFTGLTIIISVSEQTLIAEFASRYRPVILTYGRMPKITRRIRTLSFEECFARFRSFSPGTKTFRGFLPSVRVCALERETTIVLSVHDYFRGWNYRRLLLNTVQLFSTDSTLPLSSQRRPFSLRDSWPKLLSPSFHSGLWSCAP